MSFTSSLPVLYHSRGGEGGFNSLSKGRESGGGNLTHTKAKFRQGGCKNLIKPNILGGFSWLNGEHGLFTGREAVIASWRVSIAGEQFLCGGRAVSYQRKEEQQREENQVLPHKVTAIPVCFQFVSNWRRGEFYL